MASRMCMSTEEIAAELEAPAVLVPALLEDRADFQRAFEELTYGLLQRVALDQHKQVLDALAAIVDRSGFNYAFAGA